jgi:hypothetical protein
LLKEPTTAKNKTPKRGRKPLELTWVNTARLKPVFKAAQGHVLNVQPSPRSGNILAVRRVIFSEYWDKIY